MTFGQPDQLLNLACKAEIQSGGRGIYASDSLGSDPLIRQELALYAPTLNTHHARYSRLEAINLYSIMQGYQIRVSVWFFFLNKIEVTTKSS